MNLAYEKYKYEILLSTLYLNYFWKNELSNIAEGWISLNKGDK